MNLRLIAKALGLLLILLAMAMILPLIACVFYGDGANQAFALSAALTLALGTILFVGFYGASGKLPGRSAILLVGMVWVSFTLLAALPLYLSGTYTTPVDALFESASGITTTGASVLADIEALPHGVKLWRSLIQYLGGMGVIVLSIAILPLLGVGGMELYKAEAPGPTSDKLTARISETARALWLLYLVLAVLETLVLCTLGMPFFDALNHALTTMASGGFSTKNSSIAAFDSPAIEYAISVFMLLAGVNFVLQLRFFIRGDLRVFRDRELGFYALVVGFSVLTLTLFLFPNVYPSFEEAFRYALFQTASIISTTGFGTADFDSWGPFPQLLLILIMVIGGSAGSTAGGIKCVRAMMLIKQGFLELRKLVHPKAVLRLKLGKQSVSPHVSSAIFAHFFLYTIVFGVSSLVLTAVGVDVVTTVSAVISALSNVGPGLAEVGPTMNYGGLPDIAKLVLSFCMIVGRLELFTILVLLTSEFWRG